MRGRHRIVHSPVPEAQRRRAPERASRRACREGPGERIPRGAEQGQLPEGRCGGRRAAMPGDLLIGIGELDEAGLGPGGTEELEPYR
jgi:hypothetical protein